MNKDSSLAVYKEGKTLIKIAFPIILGLVLANSMETVDRLMVGRLGPAELSALGFSSGIYSAISMSLAMGLLGGVSAVTGHAVGQDNKEKQKKILMSTLAISVLASCAILITGYLCFWNLEYFNQPAIVTNLSYDYLLYVIWSGVFFSLSLGLKFYLEALGHVMLPFVVLAVSIIFNALLNYMLIFGNLGMPALGITGAGIATLLSRALAFFILLFFSVNIFRKRFGHKFMGKWDNSVFIHLLKMGIPISFTLFFEVGAFLGTTIFMGWIGVIEQAAHQIVLAVVTLAFMVPLGISNASAIRMGRAAGKKSHELVKSTAISSLLLSVLFMGISISFILMFRGVIPYWFLGDMNKNIVASDIQVAGLASSLFIIVVLFQFFDGIQVTASWLLRGLNDVKVPMLLSVLAFWFFSLPVGYFLAFPMGLGAYGIWWGLFSGLTTAAFLMGGRLFLIIKSKRYLNREM